MKFCEKLQMLRKEKGYSQEQLADLLDVSRQAVSKWESGTTYPEMDKLLSICKIFNVSLDDLTNDEITKNNIEHKKNNFSNLVYTIIEMFEKSITMFKNMNGKEIGKFFLDFFLLIFILFLCKIPFIYLNNLVEKLFISLRIGYSVSNALISLCYFIINVIYFVFFICILIYFYKTRYLDVWDNSKERKIIKEKAVNLTEKVENVKVKEIKKTKERNFVLFDILGSIANLGIKLILFIIFLALCFTFIFLVFILVLTIIAACKGIIIIGLIILSFSLVLTVGIFLNLNIAWLFNQPTHYKSLLIIFFISLVLFASSSAIFSYEITSYSFVDDIPTNILNKEETYTFKMQNDLYLSDYNDDLYSYRRNLTFKVNETLTDELKYHIFYYPDFQEVVVNLGANNTIYTNYSYSYNTPRIIKMIISNLKDKTFYSYDKLQTIDIVVETSSKNIEILKNNCLKYTQKLYENELEKMENQYQEEIANLYAENEKLANEKNKYIEKIQELQEKIAELEEDLIN